MSTGNLPTRRVVDAATAPLPAVEEVVGRTGRWVQGPDGERIFLLDQPGTAGPPAEALAPIDQASPTTADDSAAHGGPGGNRDAAPPVAEEVVGRTGRWVRGPDGERIFLLDKSGDAPDVRPAATPSSPRSDAAPAGFATEAPDEAVDVAEAVEVVTPRSPSADTDDQPISPRMQVRHSDEMQEIIGYVPGGLLRWGTTAIFGTLVVLLGISWMVRYPEMVHGRAAVTTPSPPVRLVARSSGEIAELSVADGAVVEVLAPLAIFRSSVDHRRVARLEEQLGVLGVALTGGTSLTWASIADGTLGELEVPHADLSQALRAYQSFVGDGLHDQVLAALARQIDDERRLRASLERRASLRGEELALADKARARNRTLAEQGLLSAHERERVEADYLQKRQTVEAAQGQLANSDVAIARAQRSLIEARQSREEQARGLRQTVRSAYHGLRAAIDRWQETHVLRAPIAGEVSFFRNLAAGQFVTALEPMVAIVPAGGETVATIQLDPAGAGRVAAGQRVILRFDSFPAAAFGTVEGRVESIAQMMDRPSQADALATYLVQVRLPDGLRTSYGQELTFRQEMGASADIVTQDRRLLERIFDQLYSLLDHVRPTGNAG